MTSLKFVWFLCGFLVSLLSVITSVTSLECYTKLCRHDSANNETYCFPWDPTMECENSDDRCSTTTLRVGTETILHQMCEQLCDFCTSPQPKKNCVQTCCDTDLCNTPPANDKESTKITTVSMKKFLRGIKHKKEIKELLDKFEVSK